MKVFFPLIFLCTSSCCTYAFITSPKILPSIKLNDKLSLMDSSCSSCTPDPGVVDDSSFAINLYAPISLDELRDANLVKIVNLQCSDKLCNYIAWKALGYTFDVELETFTLSDKVFPKWAKKYPDPPDLIGVTRNYADPKVDKPVRDASMDLMRSIPRDFKGGVKSLVTTAGWRIFKLNELTPNKTRRAQLVNWLIYYREKLFGKTLEQLAADRKQEKEAAEVLATDAGDVSPSEVMFQRKRLDDV